VDRNVRLLGVAVGIRTLGAALYLPFLALFLVNVLRLSYLTEGAVLAGIGGASLPFSYVGGLLADRIGRRRLILLGLAGEAATTGFLAYSFALRSLEGAIGAALAASLITTIAGPAAIAYVSDLAEGSERTRGLTFYRIGYNAGYSVGVTVGGVLIGTLGFAGSVAVATVIIAVGAVFLVATLAPSPRDLELTGRAPLAAPAVSAGAPPFPMRGVRESFGLLARDRVALELLLAVALTSLAIGQWGVTFPLFVHNVLGVSYALLGAGLALNGVLVVFGQSPTTEAVVGRRHTSIAIAGIGLYAIAFLAVGGARFAPLAAPAVFIAAVAVLTEGENLVSIPQMILPSNLAPREEIGSYNGAFQTVGSAGGILAILLGGAVLNAISNPLLVWSILLLPAIPAVLLFRHAARRLAPAVDRA
jgi:MFS family permease